MADDLRDQIAEVIRNGYFHDTANEIADAVMAEVVTPELERRDRKIEHLREKNAELQDLELGIKSLTTTDGAVDMSLHMAHDMMRILVAGFVEILDKEGGPNYAEMRFKLRDTLDWYTLTIQQPDGKSPGEVASDQRQRAEQAETERAALKRELTGHTAAFERAWEVHGEVCSEAENERLRAERDALKAHKTALLEALDMDPLRDWDDLVNAAGCIRRERDALLAANERAKEIARHPRTSQGRVKDYVAAADVLAALDTPTPPQETGDTP